MTTTEMKKLIREEYDVLTQDDRITEINTMEKPVYSVLDMREDEESFNELVRLCSKPAVRFEGRYAYLSNNFIAPMEIKGHWFLTATHAICYYRCKYACDAVKYEAGNDQSLDNVWDAVKASRNDIARANWEDVAERYYEAILDAKFRQNPELIRNLIREDGVFSVPKAEGGQAMAMALTKLMLNYQAEDAKSVSKYGTHCF